MAIAAKCNISFRINYTSSIPISGATASYKIKGSANQYTKHIINPVPISGGLVTLPGIQASGEYDFIVELTANGVTTNQTGSFKVENCSPSFCEIPVINKISLESNGQIVLDYSVNTTNLSTPEYQIATDVDFKNIIHFKVGFDFHPIEYIEMNNGNIPDDTTLYLRARKHCSPSGVSDWSNVVEFRSGKWAVQRAPYTFDAYCVSGKFEDPVTTEAQICLTGGTLLKKINLNTVTPQVGSFIYLSDGVTLALPPNLNSFDTGGASSGYNDFGIKWIRFANDNEYKIYDVEKTGQIINISSYNCNR